MAPFLAGKNWEQGLSQASLSFHPRSPGSCNSVHVGETQLEAGSEEPGSMPWRAAPRAWSREGAAEGGSAGSPLTLSGLGRADWVVMPGGSR